MLNIKYEKFIQYIVFIFLEFTLIIFVILLVRMIILFSINKAQEAQYLTSISKNHIIYDPKSKLISFYEPKPNTIQIDNPEWLGYSVKNTINADSLNERFDYNIKKQDKTYRIITLGDSFTFGMFVNTPENYTEILEDKLNSIVECKTINKFEVINLGVSGYDIENSVERLFKRGIKYNPDLVILLLNGHNFITINKYERPLVARLVDQGKNYYNNKTGVFEASKLAKNMVIDNLGMENILNYQIQIFRKLKNNYQDKLLFISFSNLHNRYKNLLKNVISSNDLFYDNLSNIQDDKNLKLLDGHPSVEGHKKIAEDLFKYLILNYFSDCKQVN